MALTNRRVHVGMLGFEPDRLVEPALVWKADQLYLFCFSDEKNMSRAFLKAVQARLSEGGIDYLPRICDLDDFHVIVRELGNVIRDNTDAEILFNAASGSKLFAMACAVAAMLFSSSMRGGGKLKVFYAKPEKYVSQAYSKPLSTGFVRNRSIEIPVYQADVPDEGLVKALRCIEKEAGENGKLDYTKFFDFAYSKEWHLLELPTKRERVESSDSQSNTGLTEKRREQDQKKKAKRNLLAAKFVKFRNELIAPLKDDYPQPLIKVEGHPKRRTVQLTSAGQTLLKMIYIKVDSKSIDVSDVF